MRVLVDESLPRQLVRELDPHDGTTVQQVGWSGLENGKLLQKAAAGGFSVFLTADQGIEFQQNLSGYEIGVVIVRAVTNRMEHLGPLVPRILDAIERVEVGEVVRILANP